jgi:murein DD-endopeptidase MepM/ murein hydrolase activator NlpD
MSLRSRFVLVLLAAAAFSGVTLGVTLGVTRAQTKPALLKPSAGRLAPATQTAVKPATQVSIERIEPDRADIKAADRKFSLSALPKVRVQAAAPSIPVPPGYGRYCSVKGPGSGWAFVTLTGADSDPCKDLTKTPGSAVVRAGLWATNGVNSVLARCDGNTVILHKGAGSAPTSAAFSGATGKTGCVFTVAPEKLPVFDRPYGMKLGSTSPDDGVSHGTGFDFAMWGTLDLKDYGTSSTTQLASIVDHVGRSRSTATYINGHDGHDWGMETGRPILAVADGIVRGARSRDVSYYCPPNPVPQAEIYIEHAVGTGIYTERFVSYYAHMSEMLVKAGDKVTRGQVIGKAGTTGCSSGPHLHMGVTRLTNGSDYRALDFRLVNEDHGDTGFAGRIEPYGWKAPAHLDPWAWRFFDKNVGAFSIDLWREGQAPVNTNF